METLVHQGYQITALQNMRGDWLVTVEDKKNNRVWQKLHCDSIEDGMDAIDQYLVTGSWSEQ